MLDDWVMITWAGQTWAGPEERNGQIGTDLIVTGQYWAWLTKAMSTRFEYIKNGLLGVT